MKVLVAGSGPNGLAAAVALAERGVRVEVREQAPQLGGGLQTLPLTEPGFRHDLCAAVHPFAIASPYLGELPLGRHGLHWLHHEIALAHPFDDGSAAVLDSLEATTAALGPGAAAAYRRLMLPFIAEWQEVFAAALGPLAVPTRPRLAARLAWYGLRPVASLARQAGDERIAALFAGIAAHGGLPLERRPTAAFALLLALAAHVRGWPIARGGSQAIADALAALLRSRGGEVRVNDPVLALPAHGEYDAVLLDVGVRGLLGLGGSRLPRRYAASLRGFRYGPGVFKIDWALRAPIPWRADACRRAGTVHLGGSSAEIASAMREVWAGRLPASPFVLLGQPTLVDGSRAPEGAHTAWAYCHVPTGSAVDATRAIEMQIERFAPGFREVVQARRTHSARDLEAHNPNLAGGAVTGGLQTLGQLWLRPVRSLSPYRTPLPGVYLCSAATPPGGGVHGMCGWHAAQAVLADHG